MSMTPEGRVKKRVKEWLKARGAFYYMPVSNGMGAVGVPDFLCCLKGRFIAIETKAPGKRSNLTPNQEQRIKEIHSAGGAALVVDDVAQLEVLDE